ncbi:MAG: hypothetical protein L0170_08895 [Acidobacteria bacterium]|nr:hypothetical protein [Acidobacteriota bacterium]
MATLLCASLLYAQKAWEKKPYTEWTQREVSQVLQESPWARSALLQGYILVETPAQAAGGPRVVARWESSLTARQALVRREELAGRAKGEAAAEYLATTPPNYVLVLFGPPLASRSFQQLTEEVVRDSTYLELQSSKQKIKPVAVRLHRQGVELSALEFHFPREIEGKPLLGPEQKKVGFYCGMGPAWFSTEFDLTKMVRDGKPDL